MTLNQYVAGSLVIVSAAFVNQTSGVAADPSVVTLKTSVNSGSSTVSTYTSGVVTGPYIIVKDSTGNYHANLDTTSQPGNWYYEWIGTGAVQAITANGFIVTAPPV